MRNLQKGNPESMDILAALVPRVTYKPGWTFELREIDRGQGCEGMTLMIGATVPNSFGGDPVSILHLMPVLAAAYNEDGWIGWVHEQIELVERHECMEFFRVDGEQPFFPAHFPGGNPYAVFRVRTPEEAHAKPVPWLGNPVSDEHFT